MDQVERYRGSLLVLAAGDALGTTLEFSPPGTFAPIADIVGGGPFGLRAGEWTDDTSMALCLAESLIEQRTFDPVDQLERYARWYREGHLSSNGRCFDIGTTTRVALGSVRAESRAILWLRGLDVCRQRLAHAPRARAVVLRRDAPRSHREVGR